MARMTASEAAAILAAAKDGKVAATEMDLPVTQHRPETVKPETSTWVAHRVHGHVTYWNGQAFESCPVGRFPELDPIKRQNLGLTAKKSRERRQLNERAYAIDAQRIGQNRRKTDGSDDQRTWSDMGCWFPMTGGNDVRARMAGKLESTREAIDRVVGQTHDADYLLWMALVGKRPVSDAEYASKRDAARVQADIDRSNREHAVQVRRAAAVKRDSMGKGMTWMQGERIKARRVHRNVAPKGAATVKPNPFLSPVYVWVQDGTAEQTVSRARALMLACDRRSGRDYAVVVDVAGSVIAQPVR